MDKLLFLFVLFLTTNVSFASTDGRKNQISYTPHDWNIIAGKSMINSVINRENQKLIN